MKGEPTAAAVLYRYEALLMLATPEERSAGQAWYGRARVDLGMYDGTIPLASRDLMALRCAILSPQLTWRANVAAARRSLVLTSRPPGVIGSFWDKAMAATWDPELDAEANVSRVIDRRKAPKTWAFALTLIDPQTGPPVIDRHMFDAAWLVKGAHADRWSKRLSSYLLCAQALRQLAERHHVPVSEVQATIWLVWKSLSNNRQPAGTSPLGVCG